MLTDAGTYLTPESLLALVEAVPTSTVLWFLIVPVGITFGMVIFSAVASIAGRAGRSGRSGSGTGSSSSATRAAVALNRGASAGFRAVNTRVNSRFASRVKDASDSGS